MSITEIVPINAVDLSSDIILDGETTAAVDKYESMINKLQILANDVRTNSLAMQTFSQQAQTALADTINANAAAAGQIITAQNAQPNLLPDHGTMIEAPGGYLDKHFGYATATDIYNNRAFKFLSSFNGSNMSTMPEFGRFSYVSSEYGGGGAALSATVKQFADVIGCSLFTPSFALGIVTAGNQESPSGNGYNNHYRFFHTNNILPLVPNGKASFSFYIKFTNGGYAKGYAPTSIGKLYINGVEATTTNGEAGGAYHKLTAGIVYHIAGSIDSDSSSTINSVVFELLMQNTHTAIVCLPWLSHGAFKMEPQTKPVRTITSGYQL